MLKQANITFVFNKSYTNLMDNYKPVSILPNLSKIHERCTFWQISSFVVPFLSKFQSDFRKGYITQHCLLAILEKWKEALDKGN